MDNKKESLKKAAGYLWSSDDSEEDDEQQSTSSRSFLRRYISTAQSAAGPSTTRRVETLGANTLSSRDEPQPSTSRRLSPSRRSQAERDTNRFWPFVNDLYPSTSSASRSRGLEPLGSRSVTFDRGPQERLIGDMQRIIAYRRFNRSFNNLLAYYTARTGDSAGLSRPCRNSLFTPAHSNLRSSMPLAGRRSPLSRRTPSEMTLSSPAERIRRWRRARAETAAAPYLSIPVEDNTPNVPAGFGVPLDTIVEIDDEPDENHQPQDVPNAANHNTLNRNGSTMESLQRHGVKRKREGHGGNSEPVTLKELNQSLLSLLECPVCLEKMEPPMAQCRSGHLVCGRCRPRLSSCPVCRVPFSSERNRAMEGVAELLLYPCRRGCGREVRLRLRTLHEAGCAARRPPRPASAALPDIATPERAPVAGEAAAPAPAQREVDLGAAQELANAGVARDDPCVERARACRVHPPAV